MADSATRPDPLGAFCFGLEIAHVIGPGEAFFKSVGGLKSETEVVPFREGGLNSNTHQLMGATKWSNLVLKRGFALNRYELIKWRERFTVEDQPVHRHFGRVVQYNSAMKPVCHWKFLDGWPCKWEGPEYDASKTELAIETIEIAHSGLYFYDHGGDMPGM